MEDAYQFSIISELELKADSNNNNEEVGNNNNTTKLDVPAINCLVWFIQFNGFIYIYMNLLLRSFFSICF